MPILLIMLLFSCHCPLSAVHLIHNVPGADFTPTVRMLYNSHTRSWISVTVNVVSLKVSVWQTDSASSMSFCWYTC